MHGALLRLRAETGVSECLILSTCNRVIFDDIQVNHIKGQVVAHYYTYLTPSIVNLLTPFSVLVSVLVTYGILSRRNEITAMKASGVSIYRVSVPVLALALLGCAAMFGLSELVLPESNRLAARDADVIKGRPPKSTSPERRWVLGTDGRFYHYDFLGTGRRPGHLTLHGLQVFDVDLKTWEMRERLYAARALWNGDAYDLERGWRRSFGPKGSFRQWAEVRTREIESAAYFVQEVPAAETLGFGDLRAHIASLEGQGFDVTALRVQLHRKLAFPLVSLVMTVLAVPFSFMVARRGALTGVVASILIALSYWFFLAIFDALGRNALLPPLLAAWAPNLLFGAVGAYLVLTVET